MSREQVTPAAPRVVEETVAERVRGLQAQARELAKDHVNALALAMMDAAKMAADIAEGGDAYPAGVRDLARRFAEDAENMSQSIIAIGTRTR